VIEVNIVNGLGAIPPAIPECILLSATLALKSKFKQPLSVVILVMEVLKAPPASKHINRVGFPNK
jgi:hypothetical protein